MRVLITGVAGLIGSKFSEWIIKKDPGIEVIGIDDLSGGYIENVPRRVNMRTMNLANDDLDGIFKKHKIRYVFHFAAYAAEGLSPFIRAFNYSNNVVASARLISKSIEYGIRRFVFTSSMAVYGKGRTPFSELDKPAPADPYGIGKYAVEMDLAVANAQHGLGYCIVRPHNVYGDNQNLWDPYRNVIGIWMHNLLSRKAVTIFGDGKQRRAFTFIDDILEPLWNAAVLKSADKEIVNLGSSRHFSINATADILLKISGYGKKVYLPPRHEVKNAWCTHEKGKRILGYTEKTDLKNGIEKMWQWAKLQPKRVPRPGPVYELNKGIYPYYVRRGKPISR